MEKHFSENKIGKIKVDKSKNKFWEVHKNGFLVLISSCFTSSWLISSCFYSSFPSSLLLSSLFIFSRTHLFLLLFSSVFFCCLHFPLVNIFFFVFHLLLFSIFWTLSWFFFPPYFSILLFRLFKYLCVFLLLFLISLFFSSPLFFGNSFPSLFTLFLCLHSKTAQKNKRFFWKRMRLPTGDLDNLSFWCFFKTNKSKYTVSQTFRKIKKWKWKRWWKNNFWDFFLKPRGNSENIFWWYRKGYFVRRKGFFF